MLDFFSKRKLINKAGDNLFAKLNQYARNPEFFGEMCVPDTPDGRFELISLFCAAIFCALSKRGVIFNSASQKLFDIVFKAFDQALRELGVSDSLIAKRIRKLSESFFGRQKSYSKHIYEDAELSLSKMIALNIFDRIDNITEIDVTLAQNAIKLYKEILDLSFEEMSL